MSRQQNRPSNFWQAWFTRLQEERRPLWLSGRLRILLLGLLAIGLPGWSLALPESQRWLAALAIIVVSLLLWSVWRELLQPLIRLSDWADSMRAVDLDAKVKFNADSDFAELARDINMLGNMIDQLSRDTEAQLEQHTDYISRESRSLAILYDVASSINLSIDLDELFARTLDSLCHNLNARAGMICRFNAANRQEIAASVGDLKQTFLASVDRFLPLYESADSDISRDASLAHTTVFADDDGSSDQLRVLSVPVRYREATLGVIHLFFGSDFEPVIEDYQDLLLSIGQHLGTAVEKFRLLEEENELLIMQERSHLSHELHDSLAQTLAGLRIQLRLIDDSIRGGDTDSVQRELKKVEYTLEQANNQVRELIAHFRVPMNQQDLISSIEDAVERCREDSGIPVYFHNEWPRQEMPAEVELNILRIVQEALANARKHSQAKIVRLLLTRRNGQYNLLIEDDGIGFDESGVNPEPGRHLGLNILRDRAQQISGNITIDSELGEGTRISLQFDFDDQG